MLACDPSTSTMCPESCRADHLQARKARPAVPAVVWQTADRQPGWSPRPRPKKEPILSVVKQSAKVDESPAVLVCYCQCDVQWLSGSLFPIADLDEVEGRYQIAAPTSIGKDISMLRISGTSSGVSRQ